MKLYKYSISPNVSEQYAEQFGRVKNILNELNQLMARATVLETKEDSTIYLHKKRGVLMEVANDRRVILNVQKAPAIDELRKGARIYEVSGHAIMRARERLDMDSLNDMQIGQTLNARLQSAIYTGEVSTGRIMDHYPSRTRFIVARDCDLIITVYKMSGLKPDSPLSVKVYRLIERELKKAGALYRKQQREITALMSALKIEIAKDELNLLNAKAPYIKEIIKKKIDENTTKLSELTTKLEQEKSEYEAKKIDASRILGGEV